MKRRDYRDLVRGDIRAFVVAAILGVASLAITVLWQAEVLSRGWRGVSLVGALLGVVLSFGRWAAHDRRIRSRLFVLTPGLFAALPFAWSVNGLVGLSFSFGIALIATYAWSLSRQSKAK